MSQLTFGGTDNDEVDFTVRSHDVVDAGDVILEHQHGVSDIEDNDSIDFTVEDQEVKDAEGQELLIDLDLAEPTRISVSSVTQDIYGFVPDSKEHLRSNVGVIMESVATTPSEYEINLTTPLIDILEVLVTIPAATAEGKITSHGMSRDEYGEVVLELIDELLFDVPNSYTHAIRDNSIEVIQSLKRDSYTAIHQNNVIDIRSTVESDYLIVDVDTDNPNVYKTLVPSDYDIINVLEHPEVKQKIPSDYDITNVLEQLRVKRKVPSDHNTATQLIQHVDIPVRQPAEYDVEDWSVGTEDPIRELSEFDMGRSDITSEGLPIESSDYGLGVSVATVSSTRLLDEIGLHISPVTLNINMLDKEKSEYDISESKLITGAFDVLIKNHLFGGKASVITETGIYNFERFDISQSTLSTVEGGYVIQEYQMKSGEVDYYDLIRIIPEYPVAHGEFSTTSDDYSTSEYEKSEPTQEAEGLDLTQQEYMVGSDYPIDRSVITSDGWGYTQDVYEKGEGEILSDSDDYSIPEYGIAEAIVSATDGAGVEANIYTSEELEAVVIHTDSIERLMYEIATVDIDVDNLIYSDEDKEVPDPTVPQQLPTANMSSGIIIVDMSLDSHIRMD